MKEKYRKPFPGMGTKYKEPLNVLIFTKLPPAHMSGGGIGLSGSTHYVIWVANWELKVASGWSPCLDSTVSRAPQDPSSINSAWSFSPLDNYFWDRLSRCEAATCRHKDDTVIPCQLFYSFLVKHCAFPHEIFLLIFFSFVYLFSYIKLQFQLSSIPWS